ncbi:hypothetical protein AVEN_131508-1 [Araneus ventricosus]|uniref:HTH psq-type domain-containing protein n=1 Tax=Araneus ventricosus TaxID=182803 RepID=A0A4Y2NV27_ARAVE|nr:hypothetical protein AVEN_88-1 [Araneus ventricosus]GBN42592.1 hypothetical protein AVEN_131508-1 [Araneus ventricosus]
MQVDAAKKYGLSQSTIVTFLKKRKQIKKSVNSNEINPQRKRLKVATSENIVAAVDSILTNIENNVEEPFKTVNVKEACDNIGGKLRKKQFVIVGKKRTFVSWRISKLIMTKIPKMEMFQMLKNVWFEPSNVFNST